jgi:hypothetical protein
MLICRVCDMTSVGAAWHWIAVLERVPGGAAAAFYCPTCAETTFQYFTKQRVRRLQLSEDTYGE